MAGTHIGAVLEELRFVERPHKISLGRAATPGRNPGAGGESGHEGVTEDKVLWTDHNSPFP